jgi:hypothetical protein
MVLDADLGPGIPRQWGAVQVGVLLVCRGRGSHELWYEGHIYFELNIDMIPASRSSVKYSVARKSRKEKVRNVTIREIMEIMKNILEVTEKKTATMVWTCKENARKQTATENIRMGTRGNAKKGKT